MKAFFKKINITIALLLMPSIGYAYGDYTDTLPYADNLNSLTYCTETTYQAFVTAELLYWRAFETGLDTCVPRTLSDIVTSDGKVISRFGGRGRDLNFDWNPGFRLNGWYELPCTCWDVGVSWTHFNTDSSRGHAHRHKWNLNLDVVDVFAGYGYDCSSCFVVRPFFGVRSARIDQKIHTRGRFEQSIDSSLFSSSISSYQSDHYVTTANRNKQKFVGVGPLIGLEADWAFGCGFSLYVSAAVTWLYGQFDVHQHQSADFFDNAYIFKFRSDLDTVLAGADAAIGVRWMTDFYCNTRLIVQVALEHHSYYDFNRIGRYGDLSFDGVSVSAGLGF